MDCSKSVRKYPFLDLGLVNEPYAARLRDVCSHVIAGGRYVGGREVEEFECELAAFCGCRYAVGTANGLDALRLILLSYIALGVMSPGDEVIVPANTYIATFLAVTHAIPVITAIISQGPYRIGQRGVIGGHGTGIAERPEIFRRVKTECRSIAKMAGTFCSDKGAYGLSIILYNFQSVIIGDFAYDLHFTRSAIEMYRHYGTSARSHGIGNCINIDIVRHHVGLYRNRHKPCMSHSKECSDICIGRHNNFVTG